MAENIHRLPLKPRLRTIDNGSVMSAAELLAWHHDNPPERPDVLGEVVTGIWGQPRPTDDDFIRSLGVGPKE